MQTRSISHGVQNLTRARSRAIPVAVASRTVQPTSYKPRGGPKVLADNGSRVSRRFVNEPPKSFRKTQISRSDSLQKLSNRSSLKNYYAGPLREVHIAIRVKELCTTGQLDAALDYCSNIPTAVQGPVAWNTIIRAALEAKRYNFAYTQLIAVSVMFQ
jgi:hypothetical protein